MHTVTTSKERKLGVKLSPLTKPNRMLGEVSIMPRGTIRWLIADHDFGFIKRERGEDLFLYRNETKRRIPLSPAVFQRLSGVVKLETVLSNGKAC